MVKPVMRIYATVVKFYPQDGHPISLSYYHFKDATPHDRPVVVILHMHHVILPNETPMFVALGAETTRSLREACSVSGGTTSRHFHPNFAYFSGLITRFRGSEDPSTTNGYSSFPSRTITNPHKGSHFSSATPRPKTLRSCRAYHPPACCTLHAANVASNTTSTTWRGGSSHNPTPPAIKCRY
jgi:hypothetical protein